MSHHPADPLINDVHTRGDCTEGGGVVAEIPGPDILCKFIAASCPSGWTQVDNWSTTQQARFGGSTTGNGACQRMGKFASGCTAAGHSFLNKPVASCCGFNVYGDVDPHWKDVCRGGCGPNTDTSQCKCGSATIVEIGCS